MYFGTFSTLFCGTFEISLFECSLGLQPARSVVLRSSTHTLCRYRVQGHQTQTDLNFNKLSSIRSTLYKWWKAAQKENLQINQLWVQKHFKHINMKYAATNKFYPLLVKRESYSKQNVYYSTEYFLSLMCHSFMNEFLAPLYELRHRGSFVCFSISSRSF